MVPRVTAIIYGDRIVERKLLSCAKFSEDLRPAWPSVRTRAAAGFENAFASEGPGWQPLSPDTRYRRIKDGYNDGPILTKSGKYRNSLTVNLRYKGTRDTITFISGIEYGRYHQSGTSRMPARKVELTIYYKRTLSKAIEEALMAAYNGG